jgi:hypothetical protein
MIEDRKLAEKIMKAAQALERLNDSVGNTPIRHAINERCVEIFLLARDGNLKKKGGQA